jgi:hypothetical protein
MLTAVNYGCSSLSAVRLNHFDRRRTTPRELRLTLAPLRSLVFLLDFPVGFAFFRFREDFPFFRDFSCCTSISQNSPWCQSSVTRSWKLQFFFESDRHPLNAFFFQNPDRRSFSFGSCGHQVPVFHSWNKAGIIPFWTSVQDHPAAFVRGRLILVQTDSSLF